MFSVIEKASGRWLGQAGPWKPDGWPGNEIGWTFHPDAWGKGYAREAAHATLRHGLRDFGLQRVVAITSSGNASSARLLESLGFRFERMLSLSRDDEVKLFGWTAA